MAARQPPKKLTNAATDIDDAEQQPACVKFVGRS